MNRRDQQIAAINGNVEGLREDRLASCRAQILSAYKSTSVIEGLSRVIEVLDREPSDFHVFTNSEARRLSHFNDDSYSWDFYCEELGRSVALAEERHIFEVLAGISGKGEPINAANPTFEALTEATREVRAKGFNPTVLIAPISLYMPVFKSLRIDWAEAKFVTLSDGSQLRLFWSSKSRPLDRFVVLDPRAGDWTVKLDPQTRERLTIAIGRPQTPHRAVMFLAETVSKYEIVNPDALYVIETVGQAPDEFGLVQATKESD